VSVDAAVKKNVMNNAVLINAGIFVVMMTMMKVVVIKRG
jgi:hypothetical protein